MGALEDSRWRDLMMPSCAFVEGLSGETTHSLAVKSQDSGEVVG